MVRRADIFGAEHQDLPEDLLRDGAHSGSVVSRDDPRGSTRRLKKRRLTPLSDNSSSLPSLTAWQPRLAKGSAVSKTITRDASGRTPTVRIAMKIRHFKDGAPLTWFYIIFGF